MQLEQGLTLSHFNLAANQLREIKRQKGSDFAYFFCRHVEQDSWGLSLLRPGLTSDFGDGDKPLLKLES